MQKSRDFPRFQTVGGSQIVSAAGAPGRGAGGSGDGDLQGIRAAAAEEASGDGRNRGVGRRSRGFGAGASGGGAARTWRQWQRLGVGTLIVAGEWRAGGEEMGGITSGYTGEERMNR